MKTDVRCRDCGRVYDGAVVADRFGGVCPRCLAGFALEEADPGAPTEIETHAPPPLKVGATFRGLVIEEELGRGGMGVVYRARHVELGRTVALKVLSPDLAGDAEFAERFQREARALASLSHPHIVAVHDFGREGDLFFLSMEFVDGVSLREVLADGRLPSVEALRIVPQICEALEYAHTQGVIHRDIKPENILIDRAGHVKIADFGLAKVVGSGAMPTLTRTDVAMGTPQYMAPEQYERMKEVDHRADIYSLGVVLYELLTGELPVGRFEPPSKHTDVDARIDEVVLKALEKRPERRYQRAAHVATDIHSARLAPRPGGAVLKTWPDKLAIVGGAAALVVALAVRFARLEWFVGIVVVAQVACGAGAVLGGWNAGRTRTAKRLAWLLGLPLAAALAWPLMSGNAVSWAAAACAAMLTLPATLSLYAAGRAPAVAPVEGQRPASGFAVVSLVLALAALAAATVLTIEGFDLFENTQRAMRYSMGHAAYGLTIGSLVATLLASIVIGFIARHRAALGLAGGGLAAGWGIAIAALMLPCVVPTAGGRVAGALACVGCFVAMVAGRRAPGFEARLHPAAPASLLAWFVATLAMAAGMIGDREGIAWLAWTGWIGAVLLGMAAVATAVLGLAFVARGGGRYKGAVYSVLTLALLVMTVVVAFVMAAPKPVDPPARPPARPAPSDATVARARALYEQHLRDPENPEALAAALGAAEAATPSRSTRLILAILQHRSGRMREARDTLLEMLRESPDDPEVRMQLGTVLASLGQHDGALGEFARVIEMQPARWEARKARIASLMAVGSFVEARAAVRETIDRLRGREDVSPLELLDRLLEIELRPDALGVTFRAETERAEVVTTVDQTFADRTARAVDRIAARYAEVLGVARAPRKARVLVLSSIEEYGRVGLAGTAGVYQPEVRRLLLVRRPTEEEFLEVLQHEGFHQFLANYLERVPQWLGEGYAEYFATHRWDEAAGAWRVEPSRQRAAVLRGVLARPPVRTPAQTMRLGGAAWHREAAANAAVAWSIVLFLRERHPALLRDYFHMLLKTGDAARAEREVFGVEAGPLDAEWLEFARGLK